MVAISCFYNHYNKIPVNFTFIQFEQFVKVILNDRIVILTNKQLVSNDKLYKMFKLSLLCTKDTSQIYVDSSNYFQYKVVMGVLTQQYWKHIEFTTDYDFVELSKAKYRNPLLAQEPKRPSSSKKIRKFEKLFDTHMTERIKDPDELMKEYFSIHLSGLNEYFTRYINHNAKNELLSSIMHTYGRDVYSSVRRFL
jgi:hypothetical protein